MVTRQDCPRLRWLQYHSGPSGTGIERTSRSIPLLGGIAQHQARNHTAAEGAVIDAPVEMVADLFEVSTEEVAMHALAAREEPSKLRQPPRVSFDVV